MHYFYIVTFTENFPLKFYHFQCGVFFLVVIFLHLTPKATQLPMLMRGLEHRASVWLLELL